MKRLTIRDEKGIPHMKCNQMCADVYKCNPDKCQSEKAITKLAGYEDAEEDGLLLRLPCKVGDTIYCFGCEGEILEGTCKAIQVDESHKMVFVEGKDFAFWKTFEKFGKTVFLTEEEAEQALKQMTKCCGNCKHYSYEVCCNIDSGFRGDLRKEYSVCEEWEGEDEHDRSRSKKDFN